jgi:hypothetical protein
LDVADLSLDARVDDLAATEIVGAKFVALQSSNHILLEQDPATQRFFEEIPLFSAS